MIIGIGVDIIEINRVEELIKNYPDHAIHKLFTSREIEYCESQRMKYHNYSGRFAAKEATMKALGAGIRSGVGWQDIEILNIGTGKPVLYLYKKAREIALEKNVQTIEVSISHSKENAVAMVVMF
ncbi:MAG: holo-[acyl-carrier-protein] synthase [Candidatus Fischerbacteria bacterium RBG_13_37_8]|uniref:Holo-[acyl-carrier-protein] synthase n=1 Tax=Candidatus Fischerbacteria bacterium RBG_13_37_8 TaxID=1817863 RepID=A0A1F5VH09_9BACT|nr:MAG: holo-[acyl-carrier-protein] synthase [Candidatus Fischerbacteria bacterium RBG_13_37_8]